MAWIALTEALVQNRLAAAELTALKSAALAGSQTSAGILADALGAVTREVRGYVGSCQRNTLGEAGTIPDELESAALALLRRHLFTRLPNMKALFDELRQKELDQAVALLRDVAACKFAIVAPTDAAPTAEQPAGTGVALVASRTRVATRETMAGL